MDDYNFQMWASFAYAAHQEFGTRTDSDQDRKRKIWQHWQGIAPNSHTELAAGVRRLCQGKKRVQDLEKAYMNSSKYRGADDDDGSVWRPPFSYHAKVLDLLVHMHKVLDVDIRCLGSHFAFPTFGNVCTPYLAQYRESVRRSRLAREQEVLDLPRRNLNAQARIAALQRSGQLREYPDVNPTRSSLPPPPKPIGLKTTGDIDLSSSWYGGWSLLSDGGFGQIYIWVQSEGGLIVDRVIVKEANGDSLWYDRDAWVDGETGDMPESVPTEVQALCNLRGQPGSHNVVQMRNWSIARTRHTWRLFLEYCNGGDLVSMVAAIKQGGARRHPDTWEDHSAITKFTPEPFAWHVFSCLARAGSLMQDGGLDDSATHGWDMIIHRDLKLGNIFLTEPGDRFEGYPQPKVGDFGLSLFDPEGRGRDPRDIRIMGTPYHMPAEQLRQLYDANGNVRSMNTKTNVWGIGIIMWSLLTGLEGPHSNNQDLGWSAELDYRDRQRREPTFDETVQLNYSPELLDLIAACLRHDPDHRPPFEHLIEEIEERISGGPDDRADGLRDLAGEEYPREHIVPRNLDRWCEGLALDQLDIPSRMGDGRPMPINFMLATEEKNPFVSVDDLLG